jgi:hypothetical protein
MKTKLMLKIAAAVAAFVLIGGISVAALARSGADSTTPPTLPVVSTPEVEDDATETPDPEETKSPEAVDQNDDSDDQGQDDDSEDSNHDSDDSNDDSEDSDHDSEDSNDDSENSDHDSEDDDSEDSDDESDDSDEGGDD